MNTQQLNKYNISYSRDIDLISLVIDVDGLCETRLESSVVTRKRDNITISELESRLNILITRFQSEYDKKLIIKYISQVGLLGFKTHNIDRIERLKDLTNFDIFDMISNPLEKVDNIHQLSDNDCLTMGVGKYTHYTKAYIKKSNIRCHYISINDICVSPNAKMSFRFVNILKKDYQFNNVMHETMYVSPNSDYYKFYVGNPNQEYKETMSIMGLLKSNLKKCRECNIWCSTAYLEDNICTCCHGKKIKYKVRDYSHKPNPKFFRNTSNGVRGFLNSHMHKNKYLGLEIETSTKTQFKKDFNRIASDVQESSELNGKALFYAKYDGSLGSGGVEFVSHPITPNAINNIDWDDVLGGFRNQLQSFKDDNCGIHIHMSRNFMSSLTMVKFMTMIYKNKSFTELIAERDTSQWAKIRQRHLREFMIQELESDGFSDTYTKFVKAQFGNRYSAINFRNTQTIELRIFKGNLKPTKFLKNIEFVLSLKEFCEVSSINDIKVAQYIGFVKSNFHTFPNLNKFLNQNKSEIKSIIGGR